MPYSSIKDVPPSLEGAGLTLAQANAWAQFFDKECAWSTNRAACAWFKFKKIFKKSADKWVVGDKKLYELLKKRI